MSMLHLLLPCSGLLALRDAAVKPAESSGHSLCIFTMVATARSDAELQCRSPLQRACQPYFRDLWQLERACKSARSGGCVAQAAQPGSRQSQQHNILLCE